jgi:hypothetical protein
MQSQTVYHCREFGATIHDARLARILSERGFTVTARAEGSE